MEVSLPFSSRGSLCAFARSLPCPPPPLSALLLAGCSGIARSRRQLRRRPPTAGPLRAPAPSGAASDAVKVDGDDRQAADRRPSRRRSRSARSSAPSSRRARATPSPQATSSRYALSAYDADDRRAARIRSATQDQSAASAADLGRATRSAQLLGCAAPARASSPTFPADRGRGSGLRRSTSSSVVPNAAWGDPQDPVDGHADGQARQGRLADRHAAQGRHAHRVLEGDPQEGRRPRRRGRRQRARAVPRRLVEHRQGVRRELGQAAVPVHRRQRCRPGLQRRRRSARLSVRRSSRCCRRPPATARARSTSPTSRARRSSSWSTSWRSARVRSAVAASIRSRRREPRARADGFGVSGPSLGWSDATRADPRLDRIRSARRRST